MLWNLRSPAYLTPTLSPKNNPKTTVVLACGRLFHQQQANNPGISLVYKLLGRN
ncbi:MAG: hypothetical protein ACSI46_28900 [Gloeotrichia echinulata DVL01]|nr:hypothetical protein [Gloeotrichia echinulata DEX184]